MDSEAQEFLEGTQKQAFYLWTGLSLSLTLFFAQSQIVFVKSEPLPSSGIEWVFSFVGLLTFLLGYFFFDQYTKLREKKIFKMPYAERKQTILVAFVLQFVLFETLGLYGVLLSVLTQNSMKAVPFLIFAYLGFVRRFPRKEVIAPFFRSGSV